MAELGQVLRLDARRTALLVAVPVLAGIGVVPAWLSLVPGIGYWDNSVVALADAVRTLGPVAAALSAWAALRERRLDYLRDLTPRSPATGSLHDLLLLSAAALVAYGVVTTVVVFETMSRLEAGRPNPLGMLSGAAALVLHVVAGYLVGRSVPRPATPPLVGAATGSWAALRAPDGSWLSLLPPAALGRVELFTTLRTEVLAWQTAWSLGLVAALVCGHVAWMTRRSPAIVPLAAALAVSGLATVRLEASGGEAAAAVPTARVCREWPLTVCVHPALRAALPTLSAAVTPLATRLTGTPGEFTRVEQRPAAEPAGVAGGVAAVHLDDELPAGYQTRVVQQIAGGLVTAPTCTGRPAQYRALVDAWLLGQRPPEIADTRAARRFAALSEDGRRTWLTARYPRYRTCRLGPADFRAPARKQPGKTKAAPVKARPEDR
ncbi:hypothetical protein [Actinomadura hibisca]|uniref:hypothetical protein n=1 Tax=Actinomadura hibisca TaxID=68565 RepID=UPI000A4DB7CA|nr:hypothetical protein [Actinomadura hibisca]